MKPTKIPSVSPALKKKLFGRIKIGGPDECWEWMGARQESGYGVITFDRRQWKTHRISAALKFGARALDNKLACHHCDNPPCCNPAHLFLGTHLDNNQDRERKGRGANRIVALLYPERMVHGVNHYRAKLNPEKIRKIFKLRSEGYFMRAIGKIVGISASVVCLVLHHKAWKRTKI
jgi:hypothetical protein